jgi:hypothetical protein
VEARRRIPRVAAMVLNISGSGFEEDGTGSRMKRLERGLLIHSTCLLSLSPLAKVEGETG